MSGLDRKMNTCFCDMKHTGQGKIDTFTLLNNYIVAIQFNRAREHDYTRLNGRAGRGKIAPAFRLG